MNRTKMPRPILSNKLKVSLLAFSFTILCPSANARNLEFTEKEIFPKVTQAASTAGHEIVGMVHEICPIDYAPFAAAQNRGVKIAILHTDMDGLNDIGFAEKAGLVINRKYSAKNLDSDPSAFFIIDHAKMINMHYVGHRATGPKDATYWQYFEIYDPKLISESYASLKKANSDMFAALNKSDFVSVSPSPSPTHLLIKKGLIFDKYSIGMMLSEFQALPLPVNCRLTRSNMHGSATEMIVFRTEGPGFDLDGERWNPSFYFHKTPAGFKLTEIQGLIPTSAISATQVRFKKVYGKPSLDDGKICRWDYPNGLVRVCRELGRNNGEIAFEANDFISLEANPDGKAPPEPIVQTMNSTTSGYNPEQEYVSHLKTLSLAELVNECNHQRYDSREREVVKQVMMNYKLPKLSDDEILGITNQMVPAGDAYGVLLNCLRKRGVDCIDKLTTRRLTELVSIAQSSEFYSLITNDLLIRIPRMSNNELQQAFSNLPPLSQLRFAFSADLKRRGLQP